MHFQWLFASMFLFGDIGVPRPQILVALTIDESVFFVEGQGQYLIHYACTVSVCRLQMACVCLCSQRDWQEPSKSRRTVHQMMPKHWTVPNGFCSFFLPARLHSTAPPFPQLRLSLPRSHGLASSLLSFSVVVASFFLSLARTACLVLVEFFCCGCVLLRACTFQLSTTGSQVFATAWLKVFRPHLKPVDNAFFLNRSGERRANFDGLIGSH
jgi:hypothetical protein